MGSGARPCPWVWMADCGVAMGWSLAHQAGKKSQPTAARSIPRRVAFLALTALLGAVAGCSGGSRLSSGATSTSGPGSSSTTVAKQVSATLLLDSQTIKAGGVLSGRVEVKNNTGQPLTASGCGGIFAVLLTSSTYHPTPIWPTCLEKITIPAGSSTYAVTVETRYNMCGGSGGVPPCTSGGPPPLPPGDYAATTFESGTVVPLPSPVPVRVTS